MEDRRADGSREKTFDDVLTFLHSIVVGDLQIGSNYELVEGVVVARQQHLNLGFEAIPILLYLLRICLLKIIHLVIFVWQLPVDQRNNSLQYLLVGDNFIDRYLFDNILFLDLHLKGSSLFVCSDIIFLLGVEIEALGYVFEERIDISSQNNCFLGILGRLIDVTEQVVDILHLRDVGLLP